MRYKARFCRFVTMVDAQETVTYDHDRRIGVVCVKLAGFGIDDLLTEQDFRFEKVLDFDYAEDGLSIVLLPGRG